MYADNMKRFFLFSCIIALLASCGGADYTISGSVDGAIDGDTVILGYSVDGINFTKVDKAVIEQGQYRFTGEVDGCKIYYIGYEKPTAEPLYVLLFLEGGDITANIMSDGYSISGTPTNELNTRIEEQLGKYIDKIYELQNKLYTDTLMSDSVKSEISLQAMETQRDAVLYIKDAISNNMQSLVGMFLLVQYADLFENEELESLIAEIPEDNIDRENNCLYDILQEILTDKKSSHTINEMLDEEIHESEVDKTLDSLIQETIEKSQDIIENKTEK